MFFHSFFPLWPFDHINVGYPAVLGQRTFTGQLFQLFFAGWQCYLPCFEESSITPCWVAVSFTQLKERSSAPSQGWQGSICRVAICPRLRPDIPFLSRLRGPYFGYFPFSFSLLFARNCIFEGIFSRIPNFLFFSTALPLLVFLFRYPLQDLQKATTWGDMCGSRRQRMVRQLLSSRANSSVKKYVLHYKGFLKYWRSKGVILLLSHATVFYIRISLVSPGCQKFIRCSLLGLFSTLKWVHDIIPHGPLDNPVDTTLSRNIIEASKRLFSRSIIKKEPVTPDMIYRICLVFSRVDSNLKDLRSALLFVLGFHGPLRISELLDLQAVDFTIHTEYLEILVKSSKPINTGKATKSLFPSLGALPVPTLFFVATLLPLESFPTPQFIFLGQYGFFKRTDIYLLCSNKLSYTRARELIKETLSAIGIDSKGFSTHSLRAGGATFIAKNLPRSDGSDRLLMLHGRWRSKQAKNMSLKSLQNNAFQRNKE